MNAKTAAAIGITLAVIIPIMLGYALNLNEVERTGWQSDNTVNVTDIMLNSSTPYYMISTSPGNNAELYARTTYPGAGTETSIISPKYISQGNNYSSLPIYTQSTATYNIAAATTTTTLGHSTGDYTYIKYGEDIPANRGYYYFESTQLAQATGGGSYLGTAFGPFLQTAAGYWSWSEMNMNTSFQIASDRNPTYTITSRPFTDLNISSDYNLQFAGSAAIKLTDINGNVSYFESRPSATTSILKSGTSVIINNFNTFGSIATVSIAPSPTAGNSITYTYAAPTGAYGNAAYGWTVPTSTGAQNAYWINGQVNTSVRMMLAIDVNQWVDLQAIAADGSTSDVVSLRHPTASNVTVSGQSLGNYQYLCLDWTKESVTVSGIAAWPSMGASPVLINSITIDFAADLDNIARIFLNGPSESVRYRIDSAEIMAGTFPSTKDFNLVMSNYWPGKSYGVSFTSIGVYGDYLNFGGQRFNVTDGTITVQNQQIRLLNAVFNSTYDGTTWLNAINGYEVSTGTASPLYFGGEWSATVSAYSLEQITGTALEWEAGGFGFDLNQFALIGLLTCGALFVALAAYGARSGAKVIWLLTILGGAAIIFLMIL